MAARRFPLPFAALACALACAAPASADTLGGVTAPISGGAQVTGPVVLQHQPGSTVSGSHAVLVGDKAYAPSKAPMVVRRVIWAANKIRHKPYKWGGGHAHWDDSGYDCSGSVSYALHGGGLLDSPLDSRGLMRWGKSGAGRWITVYATDGHAYMIVAGLRFDTAGVGERGPRWRPEPPWERGFTARHPSGL